MSPKIADGVEVDFNIITVHHWDRLFGGVLLAKSGRLPWATLLRRTFEIDVTRCRKCHARIRILCAITERATITKILEHLGMPVDPPPVLLGVNYYREIAERIPRGWLRDLADLESLRPTCGSPCADDRMCRPRRPGDEWS
ncbi:hypothetical protein WME73_37220 [Sorangium sp. So ce302]|uniref:hypothetical protein n=1 Tax=Sorangium sp. So ce302 TaxID=3133297 RepID=UPI003F60093F